MSLVEKLVAEVELKADAKTVHDVWTGRPHHIANMTPEKIQGCALHEGEYGKTGSVIEWTYVHDGEAKITKQIIEVDDEKTKLVLKIIGGHFAEDYNNFHATLETLPKADTGGCLARWTLDYERINEKVPPLTSLLDWLMSLLRDIDTHLETTA